MEPRRSMSRYQPTLVVMSGLPGTGKTTLAEICSRQLCAPVFNRDRIEATLWRGGIGRELRSDQIANELLTVLAEEQLNLGCSAIIDSVATTEGLRDEWRRLAKQQNALFRAIECVCSNEAIHRTRLSTRQRNVPGWYEVGWDEVLEVRSRFEPWHGEHLTVDCVRPLAENIARMLAVLEY